LEEGTAVSYRWDFGDGSPYTPSQPRPQVSHSYTCGAYTVRVEITDTYGNVSIGSKNMVISEFCEEPPLLMPRIYNNPVPEQ
jgi:large repetitive protein